MGKERSLIDASVQAREAARDEARRLIDLESEVERRIPGVFEGIDAFILKHIPDEAGYAAHKPDHREKLKKRAPRTEEELLKALQHWDPREVVARAFRDSFLDATVRPGTAEQTEVTIKIGGLIDPVHEIRVEDLDEVYAIQKYGEYGNQSGVESATQVVFGEPVFGPVSYRPEWSRRMEPADLDKLEGLLVELNDPTTQVVYREENRH